jgi:hypothetical protein
VPRLRLLLLALALRGDGAHLDLVLLAGEGRVEGEHVVVPDLLGLGLLGQHLLVLWGAGREGSQGEGGGSGGRKRRGQHLLVLLLLVRQARRTGLGASGVWVRVT